MTPENAMAAILACCALTTWCSPPTANGCDVGDVAVYRVVLETFWTEERFPKNYPQYRPMAQWSQVYGLTHNASQRLFRVGDVAAETVRGFAQTGAVDALVSAGDQDPAVYDQFTAPAVGRGQGRTENVFFVDGDHSLVSLASRLVPSPDWFVGVDSLQLCVDSLWLDELSLSLEPLDAGAASGLSFTAPRWLTAPPAPVTRLTARQPAHPAAAFYYPDWRHLPTLATVHFTKIKEYSSKDLNDLAHKDMRNKINASKQKQKTFAKQPLEVSTKSELEVLRDLEEEPVGTPRPNLPSDNVIVVTAAPTTSSTTTESEFGGELRSTDDVVLAVASGRRLGRGEHLPRHFRSRLHHAVNRLTEADCLVSEWGEWSACSVTCGLGERFRSRRELRAPAPGGRRCPELRQRDHCGDANSCYHLEYFEW